MKKSNEFEEFLKQLEEALDNIINEIDYPENKPINIDISLNLFPLVVFKSGKITIDKAPVDILETEKNIHAVIGLPGMEMENIKLACSGKALEITANNSETAITETIELPSKVNKTGIKSTYKNGILEVVFNKPKKGKKSSK